MEHELLSECRLDLHPDRNTAHVADREAVQVPTVVRGDLIANGMDVSATTTTYIRECACVRVRASTFCTLRTVQPHKHNKTGEQQQQQCSAVWHAGDWKGVTVRVPPPTLQHRGQVKLILTTDCSTSLAFGAVSISSTTGSLLRPGVALLAPELCPAMVRSGTTLQTGSTKTWAQCLDSNILQ